MSKWHWLVEVQWIHAKTRKRRKSSGVPISAEHILTAGHGMEIDPKSKIKIRFASESKPEQGWMEAEILMHYNDARIDAALLKIAKHENATWFEYSIQKPQKGAELDVIGFPAGSKAKDKQRDTDRLRVRYHPAVKIRTQDMALEVLPNQGAVDAWKGISGAPVLDGDVVVGLLLAGEPKPNEYGQDKQWLYALSIDTLIKSTNIAEFLTEEENLHQSIENRREARRILEKSRLLMSSLKNTVGQPSYDNDGWDLAGTILGMPLVDFLEKIWPLIPGKAKSHSQRNDWEILQELLEFICPKMFARLVHKGSEVLQADGFFIKLPVATSTIAELLMAHEDNRPAAYIIPISGSRHPSPEYEIPPPPESGTGLSSEISFRETIMEHLINELVDPDWTRAKPDLAPKFLQAELSRRATRKSDGSRIRYYFIYDESRFSDRFEDIKYLKDTFKDLAFLKLESDDESALQQHEIGGLLRDILVACTGEAKA